MTQVMMADESVEPITTLKAGHLVYADLDFAALLVLHRDLDLAHSNIELDHRPSSPDPDPDLARCPPLLRTLLRSLLPRPPDTLAC